MCETILDTAIAAGFFHALQFDYYEREIRQDHCVDTIYNSTKCSIAVVLQQTTHSRYKRDVTRRIDPLCHLPQLSVPRVQEMVGSATNGPIIIVQSRAEQSIFLISYQHQHRANPPRALGLGYQGEN